jgi:hypothetical protein
MSISVFNGTWYSIFSYNALAIAGPSITPLVPIQNMYRIIFFDGFPPMVFYL